MKNSFRFRLSCFFYFGFALAIGLPLYAEKIVLQTYYSANPDTEMESILYLSIGIELTKAGLSSAFSDETPDYRLRVIYEPNETAVPVRLSLFDDKMQEALSETEFLLHFDETLDSTVAAAVSGLLAKTNINTAVSGIEEIEGLLSNKPASDLPEALPSSVSGTTTTIATPFIDTSFAAGGLMLFGAATDYFHYGVIGALSAGYAIPVGKLALTPGLRISATRIFTEAEVTGNPLYVGTAGINLQYGTGNDRPFRASGVFSAGAAVLSTTIDGKQLNKTVPYADAGVHTGLPLGRRFFMGAEVRFLAVFDPDIFFLGAVTSLALNREL